MAAQVAALALGALGAGVALFLAAGMLSTAAILASTKAARPRAAPSTSHPSPDRRAPKLAPEELRPEVGLHLDWLASTRGRIR
ncbi:Testis-specific serine/threonine-protein kinase 1 [Frankliniella fusca]|uniref:Testis-specific serine/threonine-protein kinase 1 n=1 Tax=Frankliniella fusca TaxID=407009 RepID=A0AAE1GTD2_9NEOP|nr:Testis-specific serine/threonine-protein kinase 1 [Frankliniella fusca]